MAKWLQYTYQKWVGLFASVRKAKFLQVLCNIKYDVLSARVSVVVVPFYWWLCLFMELRFLPELSE